MARIRIVDEWLRSPVSAPSRSRAIMVVSSSWSEQRVLMRAFAGSSDQTRPTIVLHGIELAIGPAGTDPHSEWGIHVEPPIDGRAQELRAQLELAAKRLAGSKGNPPRLVDEPSSFEKKATNMWAPGTPRATPSAEHRRVEPFEPASPRARVAAPDGKTIMGEPRAVPFSAPAAARDGNRGGGFRSTPAPVHRSEVPGHPAAPAPVSSSSSSSIRRAAAASSKVSNPAAASVPSPSAEAQGRAARRRSGRSTAIGFESSSGTLGTSSPAPKRRSKSQSLGHLVSNTMPLGFNLSDEEREVLNALGRAVALSASEVAEIAGVSNSIGGIAWMEALIGKLSDHGLDLIMPGDDRGGEPTYLLRR